MLFRSPADVQFYSDYAEVKDWVVGEIVGVYKNSEVLEGPTADVASNIALRLNGVTVPVQLQKGAVRDALNLVSNPTMLNKKVLVYGVLEKYFGVPGVKSVTDWKMYDPTGIESVESENGAQVIYDLSGRRVAKAVKGLYIINGKKVYVK